MEILERMALDDLLRDRERLLGGEVVYWDEMFPTPPVRAEILAIEEVYYKGCDYRDLIVFTSSFVSTSTDPAAPIPIWRHLGFMVEPHTVHICHASNGLWVLTAPYKGVAHLHYK